jgi:hypothetical protein
MNKKWTNEISMKFDSTEDLGSDLLVYCWVMALALIRKEIYIRDAYLFD